MTCTHLLILGARVSAGEPEAVLESRLQRGLMVVRHRARTGGSVRVVVSGRGEAGSMAEWLVRHGVAPAHVLIEPAATSTNENLENAQRLLPDTERWIVVTSDFHVPRTRLWAWHLGIPVTVLAARTPAGHWWGHLLHEVVKLPYSATRIVWRRICAWVVG